MIWLPRTTDNSTYFAQSLEIRGIESRLYFLILGKRVCVQVSLQHCATGWPVMVAFPFDKMESIVQSTLVNYYA